MRRRRRRQQEKKKSPRAFFNWGLFSRRAIEPSISVSSADLRANSQVVSQDISTPLLTNRYQALGTPYQKSGVKPSIFRGQAQVVPHAEAPAQRQSKHLRDRRSKHVTELVSPKNMDYKAPPMGVTALFEPPTASGALRKKQLHKEKVSDQVDFLGCYEEVERSAAVLSTTRSATISPLSVILESEKSVFSPR